MSDELVLRNAKVVLSDEVIDGAVVVRDGKIADISSGAATGEDLEGDYLLPGFVELHTDALESQYRPRAGTLVAGCRDPAARRPGGGIGDHHGVRCAAGGARLRDHAGP